MLRWLLIVFFTLLLLNVAAPWLQRFGLGRLPGDLHFRLLGRNWYVPLASTVLMSAVVSLLSHYL